MKIIESFKGPEVAKAMGIPLSTLIYWKKSGLIKPSIQDQTGRGGTNLWSFADVVGVRVVAEMRRAGMSLQAIKRAAKNIQRMKFSDDPLRDVYLLADGNDIVIVSGEEMTSALREPGQTVMRSVFSLGRVAAEVREVVAKVVAARAA